MRIVSNLIRARYREQILFRPVKNGNVTGRVTIRQDNPERAGENSNVTPSDTIK